MTTQTDLSRSAALYGVASKIVAIAVLEKMFV